ncbi:Hym1p [Lecanora helva]
MATAEDSKGESALTENREKTDLELDSNPETVIELFHAMRREDFLFSLARSIHLLPFETRKNSQAIFSYILRFRPDGSTAEVTPGVSYMINERPGILIELCKGYEHRDSALSCGMVIREVLKHESVAAIILYDESGGNGPVIPFNDIDIWAPQSGNGIFWSFFNWIDACAFEVSADAFTTFRDILTKHKPFVARWLLNNFDLFFRRFNDILIGSSSYVTKRQSIKLLGEILLDRANYDVMTEYITRGDNLKLSMILLRDDRKMVQYEGFHVFKVFVANPQKSDAVKKILIQNRERLLRFLPPFLEDRNDDEQFADEKAFIIRTIEQLPAPS